MAEKTSGTLRVMRIARPRAIAGLLAPSLWWAQGFVETAVNAFHLPVQTYSYASIALIALWPFCFLLIGIVPETPQAEVAFRYAMSFALNAAYFMCLGLLLHGVWSLLRRCCRRTR